MVGQAGAGGEPCVERLNQVLNICPKKNHGRVFCSSGAACDLDQTRLGGGGDFTNRTSGHAGQFGCGYEFRWSHHQSMRVKFRSVIVVRFPSAFRLGVSGVARESTSPKPRAGRRRNALGCSGVSSRPLEIQLCAELGDEMPEELFADLRSIRKFRQGGGPAPIQHEMQGEKFLAD